MITKQQYEAQLQQIFRLLLENKTQEEIAKNSIFLLGQLLDTLNE